MTGTTMNATTFPSKVIATGLLLLLFAVGGLLGGAAAGVSSTGIAVAQAPACEADECDDGWFGGSCEANDGQETGCDVIERGWWFDGCETYSCGGH